MILGILVILMALPMRRDSPVLISRCRHEPSFCSLAFFFGFSFICYFVILRGLRFHFRIAAPITLLFWEPWAFDKQLKVAVVNCSGSAHSKRSPFFAALDCGCVSMMSFLYVVAIFGSFESPILRCFVINRC